MKRTLLVVLTGIICLDALNATPQAGSEARARELIRTLKLSVLPKRIGIFGDHETVIFE